MTIELDTLLDSQFDESDKKRLYMAIKNKQTLVFYGVENSGKMTLMHFILNCYSIHCILNLSLFDSDEETRKNVIENEINNPSTVKIWYEFGIKSISQDVIDLSVFIPGILLLNNNLNLNSIDIPDNFVLMKFKYSIPKTLRDENLFKRLIENENNKTRFLKQIR
jgi:hypothetical protein